MSDKLILCIVDVLSFLALLGALIGLNNAYHLSVWADLVIGAVAWCWSFHGYLSGLFARKDDE